MLKKKKKKKSGPDIFEIKVDGRFVDILPALTAEAAETRYRSEHPELMGEIKVKWECGSPPALTIDTEQFAKKMAETRRMEEAIKHGEAG